MKRMIIFVAVVALAAGAEATVQISCTNNRNVVTVSYDASSEPNRVRAFGLDISVDAGTIGNVECLSSDYYVYPGTIVIQDGVVTEWGTCAPVGQDTNTIIVEMGSLYEAGIEPPPAATGDLLRFTINKSEYGWSCVTIAENEQRGGVVMENPEEVPDVSFTSCCWCSYPACWDSPTQCHGDVDGTGDVKGSDFLHLKDCWYKCYPDPYYIEHCVCVDSDRDGCVKGADFMILKSNWYKSVPSDCPPGDLNGVFCP
jgi:hypothetical protein